MSDYPEQKISIVGGGIIGAMEAFFAYKEAKKENRAVRITVYDKNPDLTYTTAWKIGPSLTPDEILSVIPRGPVLIEKLGIMFNLPGGIRVDDVPGVNDSLLAEEFKRQALEYSKDENGHYERTEILKKLGKLSMDFWQRIYDEAELEGDEELVHILKESNFQSCHELTEVEKEGLHDGYRIDLIYNVPSASFKAEEMKKDYMDLGYKKCRVLSPDEVVEKDPFLAEFCQEHSEIDKNTHLRKWKDNAVALYRPGGCIDTEIFLPKFYEYLKAKMGIYINEDKIEKDCFHLKFNRDIQEIILNKNDNDTMIKGLKYINPNDEEKTLIEKVSKHAYDKTEYVFCPGESVGTLQNFGLDEPVSAGFAGAILKLDIPLCAEKLAEIKSRFTVEDYKRFNHCMEVHQEGVVLAWQARFKESKLFISVAGTKAFYGDKKPQVGEQFAKERNLLQLNMINDVLPDLISLALGRDTRGEILTWSDMETLEKSGIARRNVGTRAVAYDGFPTLGEIFSQNEKIDNGRTTTHLGSGGVSFSPAAVVFSQALRNKKETGIKDEAEDSFIQSLKRFSHSQRRH